MEKNPGDHEGRAGEGRHRQVKAPIAQDLTNRSVAAVVVFVRRLARRQIGLVAGAMPAQQPQQRRRQQHDNQQR